MIAFLVVTYLLIGLGFGAAHMWNVMDAVRLGKFDLTESARLLPDWAAALAYALGGTAFMVMSTVIWPYLFVKRWS